MGYKNIHSNRRVETSILGTGDRWLDKEERLSQFYGSFIRSGNNRNNSKMGEVVRVFINTIGWTGFVMGIIANFNNWIAVALGAAGFGFAIFRALKERENWLDKRIDRKKKERDFYYNRTIEESEKDEHPPIKK